MSTLSATNKNANLGTNSRFTLTFSESEPYAAFMEITDVSATDPKGTFSITSLVEPAVEFDWNPTDATFQSRVTTDRVFNIMVIVTYRYEYQSGSSFVTREKQVSVTITRTFTDAMKPTAASSAFSIAWDNAGTGVSTVSGYVAGYSKIKGTYNSGGITLATGATVKYWYMNYGSSASRTGPTQTSATGGVYASTGSCTVSFYVMDSRGFTSNTITKTCTFVPFLTAGAVTAANANFGSSVAISYGITSGSGAKYVVTSSIPKTAGGNKAESIYTGTSASTSKTFNAETYAALITDRKSVTCTITVKTYSTSGTTEVLFASKTKQITLTFAEASYAPVLNSGAFAISAVNSGAASGRSGYIQGYSKIRATYDPSKVTLKTGATVKSLSVKFGSAAAVAMTVVTSGTSTKDSAVIRETTTVVCTLTDSRGFVKTASFTATMIPYAVPRLTASAVRTDSSGNAQDDGTYIKVTFSATYAAVATDQNTMTVKVYTKTIAASSYTDKGQVTGGSTSTSGTNKVYSKTVLYSGYSAATAYSVRVTATDRFGNTATKDFSIPTETWAIHIMTGLVNGARTVVGAAAGMMATVANRFQIQDGWKFYRGSHKVFDDGDVIPVANGGTDATDAAGARANLGAMNKAGDTMTGNLVLKSSARETGVTPSAEINDPRVYFQDKNGYNDAWIDMHAVTSGVKGLWLYARQRINGTDHPNYLRLGVDASGNAIITVSNAAAWRTAINTISKAGDTMTGDLTVQKSSSPVINVKNSTMDISATSQSEAQYSSYYHKDKSNRNASYWQTAQSTSGTVQTSFAARKYINNANVDNYIRLSIVNNGTASVALSHPAAWRSALGISGVGSVTTTALVTSEKSLTTNTWTQLGSGISLAAGTWIVKCYCRFASNATGRRGLALQSTAPSTRPGDGNGIVVAASPNDYTILEHTKIMRLSAAATYYVYAVQQSGGNLNVVDAAIEYTKLCD